MDDLIAEEPLPQQFLCGNRRRDKDFGSQPKCETLVDIISQLQYSNQVYNYVGIKILVYGIKALIK